MAAPTRDQVADWLGIPALPEDQRLTDSTDAAIAWVRKRRSLTVDDVLWDDDTSLGTVMYAALLYGSRAQPAGFPGFDQLGTYTDDVGMSIHRVYQLVGQDPVIG